MFAWPLYGARMLRVLTKAGSMLAALACLLGTAGAATAWAVPPRTAAIDFGGLARTYELHLPPGVDQPSGLVVNLHAAGMTGREQADLTHYNAVADAHGFAVVYPDGIDLSWADGRGASVPDRQGVDDVGFLTALVSKLVADHGISPGRVFVTGLSAGAFMANRLACDRADLFAAIAPVAGTLGSNVGCAPSRPVAVMATYGTADPIVPFGGGPMTGRGGVSDILSAPAMVQRWRQLNGCADTPAQAPLAPSGDGTQTDRIDYAPCAPGGDVVFMRVNAGGHTWPGAPEVLSAQAVGLASHGFDASEASWQFFDSHGR